MSEFDFLCEILDQIQDPYPVTPSVVVFGLNIEDPVDQLVLLEKELFLVFEKKPPVLPKLEVLDLFIKSLFAEFELMIKADNSCQETHFFHIPAIVVGLAIRNEQLSKFICPFVEFFKFNVFF